MDKAPSPSKMEINIQVASTMEPSTEKVPFNLKKAGPTKVIFVNGQAEGKGKLTTEQEVVYEGTFKQGVFSTKIKPPYQRRYC